MLIRNITLIIGGKYFDANTLTKCIYYVDKLKHYLKSMGLNVPINVSLPFFSLTEDVRGLIDEFSRSCSKFINLACLSIKANEIQNSLEHLHYIIKRINNLLVNVVLTNNSQDEFNQLLNLYYSLEHYWMNYARVIISFNNIPLTALLPLGVSDREVLLISLNILDELELEKDPLKELIKCIINSYKEARKFLVGLCNKIGIREYKIDLAISNGFKITVSQYIEIIKNGIPFYSVGSLSKIAEVSKSLREKLKFTDAINVGKFVLSYPNDVLLKNYASMEVMSLRSFLTFFLTEILGVDLLVIPSWTERGILLNFLKDLSFIAKVLEKCFFTRIVLADAEPGEKITLGEYDDVTVIEPLY